MHKYKFQLRFNAVAAIEADNVAQARELLVASIPGFKLVYKYADSNPVDIQSVQADYMPPTVIEIDGEKLI
jgi:hypothetical protein